MPAVDEGAAASPDDERLTRRRFVAATAAMAIGASIAVLVPPIASRRASAGTTVATDGGIDHVVNGSFEDGPTGDTIPGWTSTELPR